MAWTELEKLWERSLKPVKTSGADNGNFTKEVAALYALGIGMEETLHFLYNTKPDLAAFKHWIDHKKKPEEKISQEEDALSADDLNFWHENGFVVLKAAVSRADCEATQQAIWEFLNMNADDKSTWYKNHPEKKGLMLTFTDHTCLQRNRQSTAIKKAFEQLYQSTDIYKSIDKVSFNPPETGNFSFMGDRLHWDVSLKQPTLFALQGLLYLTDCGASDGAFHCVPGFHNKIGDWLAQLPAGANARNIAQSLAPVAVPGLAGDFVIWHEALPHCATPNHGNFPRMVQYLKYLPVNHTPHSEWI